MGLGTEGSEWESLDQLAGNQSYYCLNSHLLSAWNLVEKYGLLVIGVIYCCVNKLPET